MATGIIASGTVTSATTTFQYTPLSAGKINITFGSTSVSQGVSTLLINGVAAAVCTPPLTNGSMSPTTVIVYGAAGVPITIGFTGASSTTCAYVVSALEENS